MHEKLLVCVWRSIIGRLAILPYPSSAQSLAAAGRRAPGHRIDRCTNTAGRHRRALSFGRYVGLAVLDRHLHRRLGDNGENIGAKVHASANLSGRLRGAGELG